MKCPEKTSLQTKTRSVLAWGWELSEENVVKLDCVTVVQFYKFTHTQKIIKLYS